jgi:hypothetical protein
MLPATDGVVRTVLEERPRFAAPRRCRSRRRLDRYRQRGRLLLLDRRLR